MFGGRHLRPHEFQRSHWHTLRCPRQRTRGRRNPDANVGPLTIATTLRHVTTVRLYRVFLRLRKGNRAMKTITVLTSISALCFGLCAAPAVADTIVYNNGGPD